MVSLKSEVFRKSGITKQHVFLVIENKYRKKGAQQ